MYTFNSQEERGRKICAFLKKLYLQVSLTNTICVTTQEVHQFQGHAAPLQHNTSAG